jgi:small subunit ribosomal protein S8
MTDHLADILTRIRNGYKAQLGAVILDFNTPKYCLNVLEILQQEGYIASFYEEYNSKKQIRYVEVLLKYDSTGNPAVAKVFRVSKLGRRVYAPIRALWRIQNGIGIFILSTPMGIISDTQARLNFVGGEVLCGIY